MCANYRQHMNPEEFLIRYDLPKRPEFAKSTFTINVFPGHSSMILLPDFDLRSFMWGMLPRGVTTTELWKKYDTFNARSETITESRLYKPAWNDGHRCVIPVTHYTEWRGEKGKKEKLYIREKGKEHTFIAGLYDTTVKDEWRTGEAFQTFTMLTCEPNDFTKPFHHRMPVILDDWRGWLNGDLTPEEAMDFCRPYSGELEFV